MKDPDKTPARGTPLTATALLLSQLADAWGRVRRAGVEADCAEGASKVAAVIALEQRLGDLGDHAHRVRVALQIARIEV